VSPKTRSSRLPASSRDRYELKIERLYEKTETTQTTRRSTRPSTPSGRHDLGLDDGSGQFNIDVSKADLTT